MRIPILSGIYADENADFRESYPVNMEPVAMETGANMGFLRPSQGIEQFAVGPGKDRGGIVWNGVHYRVMGSKFCKVSDAGVVTTLGDVGDSDEPVRLTYGFDRMAILSKKRFFYWDGAGLVEVTDADLGEPIDVVWEGGYFVLTDGEFIYVTDLNDPMSINPLKYTSSEAAPDPILSLQKIKNEIYAVNRYTCELFNNVFTTAGAFPYRRIESAQAMTGSVGTNANCVVNDALALLGGTENEAPSIYIVGGGTRAKIATRAIEQTLEEYTEAELSEAILKAKISRNMQQLFVHLPDRTLVYDFAASQVLGKHAWTVLTSSPSRTPTKYRARFPVLTNAGWIVGDTESPNLGRLVESNSYQFGSPIHWEFGTVLVYNEGRGAIFNRLELLSLPGRVALGANPYVFTQFSLDGENWSQPSRILAGKIGERTKRLVWLRQGSMQNIRMQRFYGTSDAHLTVHRLEADLEALAL